MKLVEDWDAILKKAWSVKFTAAAALLGGIEVAISIIEPASIPKGVFAGIASVVSVLAAGARVMQQKELSGVQDGK